MSTSGPTRWGWLAAVTVVYVAAGKLGLHFAFVHASATAVWPPTGIGLAALLLLGPRVWPAIAVGAFLVNVTTAGSVATSIAIATGNTLEALIGARLVESVAGGRHAFDRARHVFSFAVAIVPGVLVSATIGVGSLALAGFAARAHLPAIWATWTLGDLTGALVFAPLLILWATDRRPPGGRERWIELAALTLAVIVLAQVIFGEWSPVGLGRYPLAFLSIPPLLWAALRFGRREAATAVVLLTGIALRGTLRGAGPFSGLPPTESLLITQAFAATMALMALVVAALASSREREATLLQAIIDRIPVMITMYRPDARVVRLNHEFERLTGWSAGAGHGVDLMERCYPDPAYRARVRAYMDSLSEGWQDIALTTKDGRVIETSWSTVRLPDDTRIGIGLDVSERRRVESERERARAEAEAASRTKDEFFAMLGHELRNPLGAISTALHVIEICGPLDDRSVEARAIIGRQVRHLVRLVDDLLDVTRLTTGKITLTLRPVDLTAVARRAVAAAAAAGSARAIECRTQEPVWIEADETRLEQILANLLSNALKFTPSDGRVMVSVTTDGAHAVLSVEDNGVGIPADLQPRVFDLFVQGQSGLHRREPGLGVGLTLVKRLVELHHGRIEVASEGLGRGSVFTVHFPAVEPPGAARPAEPTVVRAEAHRRRVVVIEDNDDARQMLRHLLERSGHEVHEAAEGFSGLERALTLAPDAVVVDIGLPGLDGYAIARQLRAAGRPGVLLVAVTGYGQPADRLRSSAAGFDAHLTKPIDPRALEALLANHPLDRGRAGR
jgi:PAS domain S-box-containing protein